ncbi:hypothetical protein C8F01DRAFT_1072674 [Mycena amicta]|nr:hypothetical protein C8F01DRAFT_1072674 [Mycena amicta]
MPPKRKGKKPVHRESSTFRKCNICGHTKPSRGFPGHLDACKRNAELAAERARRKAAHVTRQRQPTPMEDIQPTSSGRSLSRGLDTDGEIAPMQLDSPQRRSPSEPPADDPLTYTAELPDGAYITIVPHPKDTEAYGKIIPLSGSVVPESGAAESPRQTNRINMLASAARPWTPWTTLSDFEYTETAVKGLSSEEVINAQLRGITGPWSGNNSTITLKTYREYRRVLECAREMGNLFKKSTVSAELWGEEKHYSFVHRDPWEWLRDIVTDPALARVMAWKSRRCFFTERGQRERFVDEPFTADTWCDVDDELPKSNPFPHCWLPLHIWLDKGLVTKHVTMFPIVLRLLSLPSEIRNASGNGGGVLIGFMVMVKPPGSFDTLTDRQRYEFAQFKREIYQKVLTVIFSSLQRRSWEGEPLRCGDNIPRVLYPGFLIESLDFEEMWNFTCCRAGRARHPCPRCLVTQDLIDSLSRSFTERTTKAMRAVIKRAREAPNSTQKEKILRDSGLHDVDHFMWLFRFSDPYRATLYDLLHFSESGEWAHHLWVLTMNLINEFGIDVEVTETMAMFPRWRGLKHINDPLTKDFADGQTHFDIFKCMIFVLAELLPPNSPLIACLRTLLQIRMLAGLRVMTESRLEFLKKLLKRYEACCKKVTDTYEKTFAWPKHHFLIHMVQDIQTKGVLRNGTTRTGEGMHQEVAQHYMHTNFRDVEPQIAHRDEEQEAIARTRLAVDDFFRGARSEREGDQEEDANLRKELSQFRDGSNRRIPHSKIPAASTLDNWVLGSALRVGDSRSYEELHAANDPAFRNFDPRLRNFLRDTFPGENLGYEDTVKIEIFRCLYLAYQSKDDWREGEDILRCHSNWYNRGARYDCLLFDSADEPLACARLQSLVRCQLPSGRIVDIAMVQLMPKTTPWRPRNPWDGCLVFDERREVEFLMVEHIVRGALLAPVRPAPPTRPRAHYLVDVVDGDMFLRCLNSTMHVCN